MLDRNAHPNVCNTPPQSLPSWDSSTRATRTDDSVQGPHGPIIRAGAGLAPSFRVEGMFGKVMAQIHYKNFPPTLPFIFIEDKDLQL